MPPKYASELCKQKILRFRGLTAPRGWACLIQGRFHDQDIPSDDRMAATLEPDSASHEDPRRIDSRATQHARTLLPAALASVPFCLYYLKSEFMAPITLLASAGRVAAVSKRPFLLSGSPCCVRTVSEALNDHLIDFLLSLV
jgi:hypothetical protein